LSRMWTASLYAGITTEILLLTYMLSVQGHFRRASTDPYGGETNVRAAHVRFS
jgi:hypothetical protein